MCTVPDDYQDPGTPRAASESEQVWQAADGVPLRQFISEPPQALARGAVLLIHDVWGFTDFYKDLARRIAAQGFAAQLIDFLGRQGELPAALRTPERPPLPPNAQEQARARAEQLTDRQFLQDAQGAVDDLRARGAGRVVAWGFCWGGRLAYVAAARLRGLDGVIAYYGFLRAAPGRLSPPDLVPEMRVPVLGVFGGADPGIPADQVADFEARLRQAGQPHELVTYPGAPHGFLRYNPKDHADAVQDALRRTFRFLGATLSPTS